MKKRMNAIWLSLMLGSCMSLSAQTTEEYLLWPQDLQAGTDTAKLYVYHPGENQNTGMAVVICPGGGYSHLAMEHEGKLVAQWMNQQGITAVVLKYRLPAGKSQVPLKDAARAVRLVRSRAEEWGILPDQIGIMGFSAGGHLAATLATRFEAGKPQAQDRLERYSSRPNFSILFYPVISMASGVTHNGSRTSLLGKNAPPALIGQFSAEKQVSAQTPPAFIALSDDDQSVSPLNSVAFYEALKKKQVPAVLYIFDKGGHGWGWREGFVYHQQCLELLKKWLEARK